MQSLSKRRVLNEGQLHMLLCWLNGNVTNRAKLHAQMSIATVRQLMYDHVQQYEKIAFLMTILPKIRF